MVALALTSGREAAPAGEDNLSDYPHDLTRAVPKKGLFCGRFPCLETFRNFFSMID
jgi:hypothetical protein